MLPAVVREETLELRAEDAQPIPLSLWTPDEGVTRKVVLVGHGLGADRSHSSVQFPAQFLANKLGVAVIAPDLPRHGVRREGPDEWQAVVDAWATYWASGGAASLRDEWVRIAAFARQRFPEARLGYFG